jgi:hypothetical protein
VLPVFDEVAKMCCTWLFHDRLVTASIFCDLAPGEYGLVGFVKSQMKICN